MAKFYGRVGYAVCGEYPEGSGIWIDEIVERKYMGELIRNTSRWQNSGNVNDDLTIANRISILADPFAYNNFNQIKYAEYLGVLWKVETIEVERPRLILTLGGEWNGEQARTSEETGGDSGDS